MATPAFTQTNGRLIGFYFSATPDLRAVAIDPSSGATSPIGSIATTGFFLGATAYDPVHRLEYIGKDATTLLKMNVDTGASTSVSLSQPVEMYTVDEARGILYGIFVSGSVHELRSVDVASGTVTSLFTVSAAHGGLVPGTSTFDPFNNLFYYGDSTNLIEVNVATHASRAIAVVPQPQLLIFDRLSRQLFGVVFGASNAQVMRIDPVTGAAVVVANLPGLSFLNQARAFDPIGRRFFVVQPPRNLVAANVDNGTVVTTALSDDFYILEFDAGSVDLAAVPVSRSVVVLIVISIAILGFVALRQTSE
jgi:hypothetical protein